VERQLEIILNSVEDAILSVDEQFTIVFLNDAAARRFDCPRGRALGQPMARFPTLPDVAAQLRLGELPLPGEARVVRRLNVPRPNAEPLLMEALVSCASLDGRTFYTVIIRDVSLQQEMEKAVYEARKMQAIGALAGGMAHDFNNILTAIISQIDLALTAPELAPSLRGHLTHAQTSARRGAELVNKLEIFSGRTKPTYAAVEPTDVIEQVVFMLKRSADPKVQLHYLPPAAKPWLTKADANQLMQALMNLGLNACDAMPGGGRMTLEVANVTFGAGVVSPRKPGEFVRITVGDTGPRIPPEILSRAFEPYFWTKDSSRSPRPGLAIVSATVAEHGGWMEAESGQEIGTQFHIFLPRLQEPATASREVPVADQKKTEGRERILVVDDEALVRMVTKAVLAYRGYQIIEAEDGEDAIQKYMDASPPIDLILMDMNMPRLSGHDALRRIRESHPKAKAVMFSGGLHDPATDSVTDLEGVAFLHKPFDNQELTRVVREMLDA
jgi:PAS domain S-box-containing protein